MKIKAGIFFGGPSREREISFAGGRSVYDNLNRSIFEAVPVFVDSHRNFILLDLPHLYQDSIRDFFPPADLLPPSAHQFPIYLESLGDIDAEEQDALIKRIGRRLLPEELPQYMDLAFLTLHGEYGEDGQIQRELQSVGLPYTGSGVKASETGMDKALQKELLNQYGFDCPDAIVVEREQWISGQIGPVFEEAAEKIGFPIVIRPANQGSSIGVSIIDEHSTAADFEEAVNRAFFRELIPVGTWRSNSEYERLDHIRLLTDIRDGLGFPISCRIGEERVRLYHPEELLRWLNDNAETAEDGDVFILESRLSEKKVILEEFIRGQEFSCIVLRREDGSAVALPPTGIVNNQGIFDYYSKYLPGRSHHETPVDLPAEQLTAIRRECERLFDKLGFQAYARIDGFLTGHGRIFLNDPNTTASLLPGSFLFQQAAAIGLNASEILTLIVRASLQERLGEQPDHESLQQLLTRLDEAVIALHGKKTDKQSIGVILGGYSFERDISVQSGQHVFETLAASEKYTPFPVFMTGDEQSQEFYHIPHSLLLNNKADDIRQKIINWLPAPALEAIRSECNDLIRTYRSGIAADEPRSLALDELPEWVDGVFIALHGRPGEDGQLQESLEKLGLPYNGSDALSSSVTINKYRTLQTLRRNGMPVTEQLLLKKEAYNQSPEDFYARVESRLSYPLIAKPVDNGCSAAVKVIASREQLEAYTRLMFRPPGQEGEEARRVLRLRRREEFPRTEEILFEEKITARSADRLLEITGGLVTHRETDGKIRYELFEPSETLGEGDILTMEEKFLTGKERSVTPARFGNSPAADQLASRYVREDLEKAARILNVQGYARIDAFVRLYENRRPETIIVEVNSLPALTPASALFDQAALKGYTPLAFIEHILDFAFTRTADDHAAVVEELPAAAGEIAAAGSAVALTPEEAFSFEKSPQVSYSGQPGQNPGGVHSMGTSLKNTSAEGLKETVFNGLRATWAFLKSPVFLINFAGMIGFLALLVLMLTWLLNVYTHHGESLQVHNYEGMQLDEAIKKARSRSFSVVVTDSIFILDEPPNKVLEQDPQPFSRVKENRRIYLVVTKSTPDLVSLPDLVGNYDYDQYTRKLKRLNLRFRIKERVFDSKLEENTILYFFHNDRKITDADLRKGVKVPMGSVLEFVITERLTDDVMIPDLVCKRYDAAIFLINSMNLAVGEVIGDMGDPGNAFVWKQEPPFVPGQMIPMGSQINVYLQNTRPPGCPVELDPSDLDPEPQQEEQF